MHMNPSFASRSLRLIAAASLACGLVTVGCSTDWTPGAGEPQRYGPSVGPTMPSSTPGSEQSRPLNPPMISSYTPSARAVLVQHPNLDAVAIAAANQGFRGRYLGTSDPSTPAYVQSPAVQTGQWINPSLLANPQITVNSSISSPPTPVVSSGGGGGFAAGGGTVAVATVGAASVPTTVIAASTVAASAAATQASAPAAVVAGNLGGFLNPTMSSGSTVSPTIASTPGVGNITTTPAGLTTTIGAPVSTAVTASALNASSAGATGGIVIGRTANGTISITNVPAAKPGAIRLK